MSKPTTAQKIAHLEMQVAVTLDMAESGILPEDEAQQLRGFAAEMQLEIVRLGGKPHLTSVPEYSNTFERDRASANLRAKVEREIFGDE